MLRWYVRPKLEMCEHEVGGDRVCKAQLPVGQVPQPRCSMLNELVLGQCRLSGLRGSRGSGRRNEVASKGM
jgi:hypothetical protein